MINTVFIFGFIVFLILIFVIAGTLGDLNGKRLVEEIKKEGKINTDDENVRYWEMWSCIALAIVVAFIIGVAVAYELT